MKVGFTMYLKALCPRSTATGVLPSFLRMFYRGSFENGVGCAKNASIN